MSYLALYRKYRPKTFEDVVGQQHIVKTLQNQIQADRIAHAYLFSGSRGTGKTSIAKIFARAVNCETPVNGSACMACETCKKIDSGVSMNIIEIDAASHNGVDNIREINEEVKYQPAIGSYKVYIIDEVHMLSTGAFNALLKTLEEPPAHIIFILATTDPQKIPVTVLSRCQRFDFKRIQSKSIEETLNDYMEKEQIQITGEALAYIARLADGGMRDALSLLEQCISFYYEEEITLNKVLYLVGAVDHQYLFEMINAIKEQNCKDAIEVCDVVNMQGRSIRQFTNDLLVHTRNLLVAKTTNDSAGVLDYSQEYIDELNRQAETISVDSLMRYIKTFSELDVDLKVASNPKVSLEVAILKLCEVALDTSSEAVADQINALEQKLEKALAGGISIGQTSGAMQSQPIQEEVVREVPKNLQAAVPEDIDKLIKKWDAIKNNLRIGARITFGSMQLGSLGGSDTLYLIHDIGMEIGISEYMNDLKAMLTQEAGKELKIVPIEKSKYEAKSISGADEHVEGSVTHIENSKDDIQSKVNFDITVTN